MNITIGELMVSQVMTATPSQTVQHVRDVMHRNGVSALPVVNPEGEPIGIVSTTDLLGDHKDATPIRSIMTEKVLTVPQYSGPHVAARVMRNHHVHRVIVTHEQKIVGILSAFDLLQLVEDHRFVMKPGPGQKKRKRGVHGRADMGVDPDAG